MKETIVDIINVIRPKKTRGRTTKRLLFKQRSNSTHENSPDEEQRTINTQHNNNSDRVWSQEQERIFTDIVSKYGCDYSLLSSCFPKRSRKQIIKKFTRMHALLNQMKARLQQQEGQRVRNTLFETEILEIEARDLQSEKTKYLPNRSI